MVNKVTVVGFRGSIAPLWIRPWIMHTRCGAQLLGGWPNGDGAVFSASRKRMKKFVTLSMTVTGQRTALWLVGCCCYLSSHEVFVFRRGRIIAL